MLKKLLKAVHIAMFLTAATLSGAAENPSSTVPSSLLERARSGDAQAQLEAGFAFFKLNQPIRAAYWFAAAARSDLPQAQYNLGRCFMEGYGVEKNLHRALECFKQAAGKLPEADLMLAKLCLSGINAVPDATPPRPAIAPDEAQGIMLLDKLTESGNLEAHIIYAEYLIQKHPANSAEKIIKLLDHAANKDSVPAQIMLADYLLTRQDRFRNEKRARELLEKASDKSHDALVKLAFVIEKGFGAPPDLQRAGALYEKALKEKFSPLAASQLANYCLSGRGSIRQDIPRAVKLYTLAAEAGLPDAIYHLGECYRTGLGVKPDAERGFEYLFMAAQKNHALAQLATADALAQGTGTPQDQAAAFYWYKQAAVRYEPRAMLEVGKRCLNGIGTDADPVQAAVFLEQALASGMNEARELLPEARRRAAASGVKEHPLPEFKLKSVPAR